MKQFLLVRHAKSDWSDDTLDDFDRPLNERGRHDAPRMAAFIASLGLKARYLLASPAHRAYTTARLFSEAFGVPENDIALEDELYEANAQTILTAVRGLPDQYDLAAVFAHNPGLTYLTGQFTDTFISNVPTCGVAHVTADVEHWAEVSAANARLRELYAPKAVLDAYKG